MLKPSGTCISPFYRSCRRIFDSSANHGLHDNPIYGMGGYISSMPLVGDAVLPAPVYPEGVVCSWTEWQPLREIIMGRCEMSCIPPNKTANEEKLRRGQEELEGFCEVLQSHGVVVRRPDVVDWSPSFNTPDFETPNGNTGAMQRDVLICVGNEIMEAPMSSRSRYFEYIAYRSLLNEYFERDSNFSWSAAPKPTMNSVLYSRNYPHEAGRKHSDKAIQCDMEAEPSFDAADVVRFGRDLFVCNSSTTNRKGYDWLRRHFNRRGLRVHFLNYPQDAAPVHLDVKFVPLSSNVIMLHPAEPPRPWVKRMLRENGWKVIVGVSNDLKPAPVNHCSELLALNMLSLDEKRVIVEAQETRLQDLLSKNGFEPIPVPFRSLAEVGGALHRFSTDVRRDGVLASYFPHIDELEEKGLECQFAPFGEDSPMPYKP